MSRKAILVIAAHPDDEVLGCGATIAKHAGFKDQVDVLVIGDGLTGRTKQKKVAEKQACAAAKILGVRDVTFGGLPACRFDVRGQWEITKIIETQIRLIQPDTLYLHHYGDLHHDHRMVFEAAMPAARPVSGCSVKRVLCFEIPSSTDWAPPIAHRMFKPNVFVDVSKTFQKKMEALKKCYADEMREFPHPRSEKAIEAYARRWGAVSGLRMAEAFELIRDIR